MKISFISTVAHCRALIYSYTRTRTQFCVLLCTGVYGEDFGKGEGLVVLRIYILERVRVQGGHFEQGRRLWYTKVACGVGVCGRET